ncbi:tRNA(Ile)-lysidine synthetase [Methylobacterium sp. Leaf456]|uniref:tRNA lysidine(34) synthetase TilS n=1 Tax=Methylobacterium sp. Leaf456 TaxID=1736382 RepID=UPI0006F96271|nr:tRNA lysidine(34) synthetase TilS [Methylobacterium sp. Leaf456]KQT50547.1 tRNA(Ile)-lysidine synthetase [Methylobacterium sp. Leaf456]
MRNDDPLSFSLAPFLDGATVPVLLAVSGGPDSTALMHAAAIRGAPAGLFVATIDHGLRAGSADEAAEVARLAQELGLPHTVLTWETPRRAGRIQAEARAARYQLLAQHAKSIGANRILTAHTRDDQAETVLMRLIAGSGPAGLAGMRNERPLGEGLHLARPFLDIAKADLVAYCAAHALPFVHDPSNADERFARARLRRLLPLLEGEGLSTERLARLAARIARDEAALAVRAATVLAQVRLAGDGEVLTLDGHRLAGEPVAIVLRVLDTALGHDYAAPPKRLERLENLVLDGILPALARGEALRRTLRGQIIGVGPSGRIRLTPAPPRRPVAPRK